MNFSSEAGNSPKLQNETKIDAIRCWWSFWIPFRHRTKIPAPMQLTTPRCDPQKMGLSICNLQTTRESCGVEAEW